MANQNTTSVLLDKELISQLKKRIKFKNRDLKQSDITETQVVEAVISLLLDLDPLTVDEIDKLCSELRKIDLVKSEENKNKGFIYIADYYKDKAHQEYLFANMLHILCRQKEEIRMEDDIEL